ncbi:AMP-binding protein [Paracoccus aminophilus]|uniref:Fatty-acyl-CoA synthase n=1 Tax=Paracoccus aminophilus JCM 7686 TaxID=1367847 RepID=S5XZU3_PARAH|nr:AMP-binding protein [Paracoccus aminophilus]AGT08960.1 fatty-acyl-CoA synthase [Paracoccus aminophilus JCM 7686]
MADILSALRAVAAPSSRAIRFFDLAELEFDDVQPSFVTHAELQAQVIALANAFRAIAGHDRPVVTILAPSTIEGLIALLAAEVAGVAHPVNYLLDAAGIADCMNAVGSEIVVTGHQSGLKIAEKLAEVQVPSLRATVTTGRVRAGEHAVRALIAAHPSGQLQGRHPQADDLAALFHTAGTTGKSKVVPLTHANLLASAHGIADAWQMDGATRIVNALPFFHVAGANLLALGPLIRGAEVLLLSETGLRNPAVLSRHWEIVQTLRPTIIGGIPSSLVALLDVPLNGADLSSVRFCATGGAPMPATAGVAFEKQFGLQVHTIYGMTEAAGLIATARLGTSPDYDTAGQLASGVEAGVRPFGSEVVSNAPDAVGTICIRAPQVFRGYAGLNAAEGFLPGGWFETGDIGNIAADGTVTISGRAKDVIIRAGNNLDPAEIEIAANSFPGVADSAAVAMPDRYAGEVPVLYLTARAGQRIATDALEAHLRNAISDPQARPTRILVVEKLPLTSVGKVSRLHLRQWAATKAAQDALGGHGLTASFDFVDNQMRVMPADEASAEKVMQVLAELGLRAILARLPA